MTCPHCSGRSVPHAYNRNGTRRYYCLICKKTFSERRQTIGNRYLSLDKTTLIATLLAEGNSMLSTARIVDVQESTVASLLEEIGRGCSDFMRRRIRNFDVSHLELDETWSFVKKKQKRVKESDPPSVGDAYTYIAIDRATRLVPAWHLGKRDGPDTARFVLNVRGAVSRKRFQISTDGWEAYEWTLEAGLSDRASYGRIVKVVPPGRTEAVFGNPDVNQIETTYVERFNGTLRQWCKRYTRKTYAFSKKWNMLRCAIALNIAHYNFCRVHGTLRVTPAMASGYAKSVWSMDDLLKAACN